MGTDIDGYIEYRDTIVDEDLWFPAMKLSVVYLGRDYSAFGQLFGIRNTQFQPIAAERGLPEDVSACAKEKAKHTSLYGHTWISWREIKSSSWQGDIYWNPTLQVLEILASLYGDDNIRLVVWFEN